MSKQELGHTQTSDKLLKLIAEAKARYEALSPEEKATHDYAQRRSFVRGMCPDDQGFDEYCKAVDKILPPISRPDIATASSSDDMVERLRSRSRLPEEISPSVMMEAADEIERLRASPLPADNVVDAIKDALQALSRQQDFLFLSDWRIDRIAQHLARHANLLRQSAPVANADLVSIPRKCLEGIKQELGGGWIANGKTLNELLSASPPADVAGMPREAVEQLTNHQEQCDFDGVMVKVSRQALDEVLEFIRALPIPESKTDAAVKALVEALKIASQWMPDRPLTAQAWKDAAKVYSALGLNEPSKSGLSSSEVEKLTEQS